MAVNGNLFSYEKQLLCVSNNKFTVTKHIQIWLENKNRSIIFEKKKI
jgi:hypothetical protein